MNGYEEGDAVARLKLIRTAQQYQALLSDHINKEEKVLFPWAEQLLTPRDHENLLQKFEKIERTEVAARNAKNAL